ncbi:MAG: hypothetical protein EHM56_06165 [Chloroflexi bacterium]|nr:MAG: hypothetical protein EHM56_06165 [Chloroflexota bacterium]
MDAKAATALPLRLLELEQRFESYCTLHEEELKEIRSTLNQLRADMLALSRSPLTDDVRTWPSPDNGPAETADTACGGDGDGTGANESVALDSRPILAL